MPKDHLPFVFLTSVSKSGSTLLSFLLNAHPEIATVGEMTGLVASSDPETYLCSCGRRIKDCPFWHQVRSAMHAKGFEFNPVYFNTRFELGKHRLVRLLRTGSLRSNTVESIRDKVLCSWPGHIRQLKKLAIRNTALAETVLEILNKRVFFDTSKHHMRIKYLDKYSTVDLRVVHLVRDVRGVVTSYLSRRHMSVQCAARRWVKGNRNIERQLEAIPADKQTRILYEDLCQDTQNTLEHLYRFCGVESGIVTADFRSLPHHIVGNVMRLRDSSEIKLDERWRRTLSINQLEEIDRIAGSKKAQYGYV